MGEQTYFLSVTNVGAGGWGKEMIKTNLINLINLTYFNSYFDSIHHMPNEFSHESNSPVTFPIDCCSTQTQHREIHVNNRSIIFVRVNRLQITHG